MTWCKQNKREVLLEEFDKEKNKPLTTETIACNSNRRVWWKCYRNHSWCAPVARRTSQRSSCPYCSGRLVIPGETDLQTMYPDIASEWHPTKNAPLLPSQVKPLSCQKVWWLGKCGHEWYSRIDNRSSSNKRGCPICAGRQVVPGINDLESNYPELAKEWDFVKNVNFSPVGITCGSQQKVWWRCPICGNSWKASVVNRVRGNGCYKCSSRGTSLPEQGIAFYLSQITEVQQRIKIKNAEIDIYLPEYKIGIEYDGAFYHESLNQKNRDQKKENLFNENCIILIRVKEAEENQIESSLIRFDNDKMGKNYEWAIRSLCLLLSKLTNNSLFSNLGIDIKRDYIAIRERINLYHKEKSLAVLYPNVAKEWNYDKNGRLKPEQVYASSHDIVWWRCSICNNVWQDLVYHRTGRYKYGCPYCSNKKVISGINDLATDSPEIAVEWDYSRNKGLVNKLGRDISTPDKVSSTSNQKVWWICSSCSHSWCASIDNRAKGKGCPVCGRGKTAAAKSKPRTGINDLASHNPEIAKDWDYQKNYPLTPDQVAFSANKKVFWKCSVCNYGWETTINNRSQGKRCPMCSRVKSHESTSKAVECIETGKRYSSMKNAENATGIKAKNISACCRGDQKTAGGYHWKTIEKDA